MRALLDKLLISFTSDDSRLLAGWSKLFDLEIEAAASLPPGTAPDIKLNAAIVAQLPPLPEAVPRSQTETGVLYFDRESGGILRLARPAQIQFNYAESQAAVTLTKPLLDAGNLEDITMTALAPFLRRRGTYMVHAFAAAADTAVLLCGPSGSGKTTTGLALLQNGWRYLANDVTLLRDDLGRVNAYPSPGAINIHPRTLTLLPKYEQRLRGTAPEKASAKYFIPRTALLDVPAALGPAPVSAILFPSIASVNATQLKEIPSAIGLARLIEESIDRWDEATMENHLDLLTRVSRQAQFFDLQMPRGTDGRLAESAAALSAQLTH